MPTAGDWVRIAPELVLLGFAVVILLADVFVPWETRVGSGWLTVLAAIGGAVAIGFAWGHRGYAFGPMLNVDGFSLAIKGVLVLALGLTGLISISYIHREKLEHGEYYVLLILSTIGMMLLASSANLIMLFLSLEVLSIALYILTGFARTQPRSEEASMKYFLLGSFASAFLLYGAALMYGATRSLDLPRIAAALPGIANNPLLLTGAALVLVGLGFKVAVVPFQMWTPDVYEGAPTTVTAFMSVGTKAAAFAALVRVFVLSLGGLRPDWGIALWIIAALTMGVGNIIAITQDNIKRMLAYSSVAHAGYILMAVIAANEAGLRSIPFYLAIYAFMNIGAFTVAYLVAQHRDRELSVSDYSGLFYRRPWLAIAMATFMFGLAGLPPTGGFMAKLYVFAAAVQARLIGLVVIGVLTTLISVYYYVRITVMMFMHPPKDWAEPLPIPGTAAIALVITVIVTILLGVYPGPLFNLSQALVR